MIEKLNIDAVLTEDESELLTIINGLEEQASLQETKIEKIKNIYSLMVLGSATSLVMSFIEKDSTARYEYLTIAAGFALGGIERIIKERKLEKDIRNKNRLAVKLKQELEPTDLDRYEYRDIYVVEEDDDDEYYMA